MNKLERIHFDNFVFNIFTKCLEIYDHSVVTIPLRFEKNWIKIHQGVAGSCITCLSTVPHLGGMARISLSNLHYRKLALK